MQTENTPAKRTYTTSPNSKRQKIIRYFKENPEASPAEVARKFVYSYGATHTCKRLAAETPPEVKVVNLTNGTGWIEGLGSALAAKPNGASQYAEEALAQRVAPAPEPLKHSAPLFSWADYGLWMDRDNLKGYLRGRAVEYLTKGDKLSVEEALRCVTKLSELTD